MFRRVLMIGVVCVLMSAPAWALPITVDNFDSPSFDTTNNNDITEDHDSAAGVMGSGGVPPGDRDIFVDASGSTGGADEVRIHNASGVLTLATDPSIDATLTLSYGSYADANGDTPTDLDADLSSQTGLSLLLKFADLGGELDVKITTDNDGTPVEHTLTGITVPQTATDTVLPIPFSGFGPALDAAALADVDGIELYFVDGASWDVKIDEIRTTDVIPEPATLSLLGLGGIAALIRRRRKK